MATNQFTPMADMPDEDELKQIVDNFEYKKLEIKELPHPIVDNGLVNKCNSFVLAASGSTECMLYSFVGLRPDKGDVIDEHPFVFYYDYNDPKKNFGGIIHHGDWPGRTVQLESWQIDAISSSGLTANFTYKSIPPGGSGSLDDLNKAGLLEGISKQFNLLLNNKPK